MKNIRLFRYEVEWFDDLETRTTKNKGIVAAFSYEDAIKRIRNIYANLKTGEDIIGLSIYEIDSWDGKGIIEDEDIKEIIEYIK